MWAKLCCCSSSFPYTMYTAQFEVNYIPQSRDSWVLEFQVWSLLAPSSFSTASRAHLFIWVPILRRYSLVLNYYSNLFENILKLNLNEISAFGSRKCTALNGFHISYIFQCCSSSCTYLTSRPDIQTGRQTDSQPANQPSSRQEAEIYYNPQLQLLCRVLSHDTGRGASVVGVGYKVPSELCIIRSILVWDWHYISCCTTSCRSEDKIQSTVVLIVIGWWSQFK